MSDKKTQQINGPYLEELFLSISIGFGSLGIMRRPGTRKASSDPVYLMVPRNLGTSFGGAG
jgi:hypothetical protein